MKLTLNLASRTCVNRRAIYAFYAGAVTLMVLLLGQQIFSARKMWSHGEQVRSELSTLQASAGQKARAPEISPEQRKKIEEEVSFANQLIEKDGFRWTALLDRLEDLAVDGIALSSVQPDFKAHSLRLSGVANELPQLQDYLDNLLASPDFSEVYLLNQASVSEQGERKGISFSLLLKGAF